MVGAPGMAAKLKEALDTNRHPTVEDLRTLVLFRDLPDDGLEWMASQLVYYELQSGDIAFERGMPADYLVILFEGEMRAEREDGRVYVARGGQVTGMLPYSRLTHYPSSGWAETRVRGALLHKQHFPEMLERMPVLRERLVNLLADRIRENAKAEQQHEKLAALGKLSAGLAHELNNPAAAARRAAASMRQAVSGLRTAQWEIERQGLDQDARLLLAEIDCTWAKTAGPAKVLDSLEQSEYEESLAEWLQERKVSEPWELAATLADTGASRELLETVASRVPAHLLSPVLKRLAHSFSVTRLIDEIESSTGRVSEIIQAIKEYSYMDQAPEQEIDIHQGIENTLIMLRHRLKQGVDVVREYDGSIPKVSVHGSELNQVWTNLITNAIDAMQGQGKLTISTRNESRTARVDIVDNGPGIPPEVQDRIFEPFFTTKPMGEGTGLGLDSVYRIVQTHRGRVEFQSKPGETRFTVRLPLGKIA